MGQRVCTLPCALKDNQERRKAAAMKQYDKETRHRRNAIKSTTELANEAQKEFNKYIRTRDAHLPCISCGRPNDGNHQRHASHYRSVKAAKQLRFNTYNVHASCMQCNSHDSGRIVEYRIGLENKIGREKLEAIEYSYEPFKPSKEYLRRLKTVFAKRARHIERLRRHTATHP
jgi:hypothetical protein